MIAVALVEAPARDELRVYRSPWAWAALRLPPTAGLPEPVSGFARAEGLRGTRSTRWWAGYREPKEQVITHLAAHLVARRAWPRAWSRAAPGRAPFLAARRARRLVAHRAWSRTVPGRAPRLLQLPPLVDVGQPCGPAEGGHCK